METSGNTNPGESGIDSKNLRGRPDVRDGGGKEPVGSGGGIRHSSTLRESISTGGSSTDTQKVSATAKSKVSRPRSFLYSCRRGRYLINATVIPRPTFKPYETERIHRLSRALPCGGNVWNFKSPPSQKKRWCEIHSVDIQKLYELLLTIVSSSPLLREIEYNEFLDFCYDFSV